jgi:hypothetical protein
MQELFLYNNSNSDFLALLLDRPTDYLFDCYYGDL